MKYKIFCTRTRKQIALPLAISWMFSKYFKYYHITICFLFWVVKFEGRIIE